MPERTDGIRGPRPAPGSTEKAGWTSLRGLKEEVLSVREEVARRRSPLGRAVDRAGEWLGSAPFLAALALSHVGWVLANLPFVPWRPWDPYPFVFLATVASVEAPFIAILVLMRQQQDRHVDELREEVQLQVALLVERETTAVLRVLDRLRVETGLDIGVEGLENLEDELNPARLIEDLRSRLDQVEEGSRKGEKR